MVLTAKMQSEHYWVQVDTNAKVEKLSQSVLKYSVCKHANDVKSQRSWPLTQSHPSHKNETAMCTDASLYVQMDNPLKSIVVEAQTVVDSWIQ